MALDSQIHLTVGQTKRSAAAAHSLAFLKGSWVSGLLLWVVDGAIWITTKHKSADHAGKRLHGQSTRKLWVQISWVGCLDCEWWCFKKIRYSELTLQRIRENCESRFLEAGDRVSGLVLRETISLEPRCCCRWSTFLLSCTARQAIRNLQSLCRWRQVSEINGENILTTSVQGGIVILQLSVFAPSPWMNNCS